MGRRHLSGGILSASLWEAAGQEACILERVTFGSFLCCQYSRIPHMEKKRGKERPGNSTHPREEGKGCRGRRCVLPSLPTWVSLWPKGAVEPKGNACAPFFSLPGDETAYGNARRHRAFGSGAGISRHDW